MMEKVLLGVILVLFVSSFVIGMQIFTPVEKNSETNIKYNSNVCIFKNNELIQCTHNVFTNMGKNVTRNLLGNGVGGNISWIGLGNDSTPAATETTLAGEQTHTFCNLTRRIGAYAVNTYGYDGNWTMTTTFTCNCTGPITVNTTGLYNASSGNYMFAGNSFTGTNLTTNDQLQIQWQIWVS